MEYNNADTRKEKGTRKFLVPSIKDKRKKVIKMNKTEPRTLAGFMELLPSEQILFDQMKGKIENTYQKYGFLPLDTPIIELSEVLLAKARSEKQKNKFTDLVKEKQIFLYDLI